MISCRCSELIFIYYCAVSILGRKVLRCKQGLYFQTRAQQLPQGSTYTPDSSFMSSLFYLFIHRHVGLQPIGNNLAPQADILTAHSATLSTTNDATSAAAGTSSKHQPTVEFVKNISYHNAQHQRVHHACRIIHEGQSLGTNYNNVYCGVRMGYWEQLNTSDYLEINLGYPRCVTHIGTAGAFHTFFFLSITLDFRNKCVNW